MKYKVKPGDLETEVDSSYKDIKLKEQFYIIP